VAYFPTAGPEAFRASEFKFELKAPIPPEITPLMAHPLAAQAQVDFPGKVLAFRAITTSVNGCYDNGDRNFMDVTNTERYGIEKWEATTRVAVLDPEDPDSIRAITPYILHAGIFRSLESKTNPARARDLFPAVLAYDVAKLEEREISEVCPPLSDSLLGVYVLDCITNYAATLEPTHYK
jgi:hypothetical protein